MYKSVIYIVIFIYAVAPSLIGWQIKKRYIKPPLDLFYARMWLIVYYIICKNNLTPIYFILRRIANFKFHLLEISIFCEFP